MATETIRIIIEGDNKIGGSIRAANKNLGDLKLSTIALGTAMGNVLTGALSLAKDALLGIGRAAVNAAGAFVSWLGESIGMAADLEEQMSTIESLLSSVIPTADELTAAMADLDTLIQDLGLDPNLKVSADEAAAAVEMLVRNGMDVNTILGTMADRSDSAAQAVILLSNATGGDFARSADIATDVMAIWGDELGNIGQAVNGIVAVTTNSKFAIDDFRFALAQAGGVAAISGVEFGDFTTAIAGISPMFAGGSDAGTSFKVMLQNMIPKSADASDAMRNLGLEFFNADGSMKDLANVAGDLNRVLLQEFEVTRQVGGATDEMAKAAEKALGKMPGLTTKISEQKTQLGILQRELGATIEKYGEGSTQADRKRLAITKLTNKIEENRGKLTDHQGALDAMTNATIETITTTDRLTEKQRINTLHTIFGTDAMRAAAGMAALGAEGFRALQEQMGKTDASQMAAIRMDNLRGTMEILGDVFDAIKIQIGSAFLPVLTQLAKKATDLASQFGPQLVGMFEAVAAVFSDFVSGLMSGQGVLSSVGDLLKNFLPAGLVDTVMNIAGAFSDFVTGLMSGQGVLSSVGDLLKNFLPAGLVDTVVNIVSAIAGFIGENVQLSDVLTALGAIIAGVVLPVLYSIAAAVAPVIAIFAGLVAAVALVRTAWENDWGGIRTTFTDFWAEVQPILAEIGTLFGEIFSEIGTIVSDIFGGMAGSGDDAVNWSEIIKGAAETVITVIRVVAVRLKTVLESIRTFWDTHGRDIVTIVTNFVGIIKSNIETTLKVIMGVIKVVLNIISGNWAGAWKEVGKIFSTIWKAITGNIKRVVKIIWTILKKWLGNIWKEITTIWNAIKGFIQTVMGVIQTIITTIWGAIQGFIQTVMKAIQTIITTIWNAVKGFIQTVMGAIQTIITTIWNAIKGFVQTVMGAIQTIITTIWNAIKGFIQTVMNTIQTIITLIWTGIKSFIDTTMKAIQTIITTIWNAIKSFIQTVMNTIQTIITTIWNAIKSFIQTVMGAIQTIITTIWNAISAFISTVMGAIQTIITTIWNAISAFISTVMGAIQTIITTIWNAISAFISTVMGAIQTIITTIWNAILGFIQTVITAIQTAITTGWNAIQTVIQTVMGAIQTIITTIWNAISAFISTVITAIQTAITTGWNAIQTVITTVMTAIQTAITTGWAAVQTVITTVMTAIQTAMTTGWNAIQAVITTVMNAISGPTGIITTGWNAIKTAMESVLGTDDTTGLRGLVKTAWDGIKGAVETVMNLLKGPAGIVEGGWSSISTAMGTILGTSEAAGLWAKAKKAWNGIKGAVTTVMNALKGDTGIVKVDWTSISTAMGTILGTSETAGLWAKAKKAWNGIKGAVTTALNALKGDGGIVKTGWNAISTAMGTILGTTNQGGLWGIVNAAWGGMKSTIENAFKGFRTSVNKFIDNVNALINAWNAVAPAALQVTLIPKLPALTFASTTALAAQVAAAGAQAVTAAEGVAPQIGNALAGGIESGVVAAGDVGPNIVDAIVTGIEGVTDFGSRVGTIIAGWVNAISWPPFTAAGVSFVTKLIAAITAAGSTFRSALESFINTAVCAVIGCSPDGSAAKRIKGGGERMVELLIEGLRKKAPALQAGLKGLVEAAGAGLGAVPLATTLLPAGGTLPGGLGGLPGLSPVTVGATLGAGPGVGAGGQVNHYGGNIFNATINNPVDEAEFFLRVEEALRRIGG